jgi:hypothetical protein
MRKVSITKLGSYFGGITALIIYVLVWLLPVAYFSGALGSKVGKYLFADFYVLITGIFILTGVVVSGSLFCTFGGIFGWFCGTVIDSIKKKKGHSQVHTTNIQKSPNEIGGTFHAARGTIKY